MSSQSVWFAYDPQWATSIRTRLNEFDISDLWLFESPTSISTPRIILDKYLGNPIHQLTSKKSIENEWVRGKPSHRRKNKCGILGNDFNN